MLMHETLGCKNRLRYRYTKIYQKSKLSLRTALYRVNAYFALATHESNMGAIDAETPHSLKKRIVSSNNVIYFPGYLCQIINNMAQKRKEVLVLTYKL